MTRTIGMLLLVVSASVCFKFYVEAASKILPHCECKPFKNTNFSIFVLDCRGFNENTIKTATIPQPCNISLLYDIDFERNNLPSISNGSFLLNSTEIKRIKNIILKENRIEEISEGTFRDFKSLVQLEISKNNMSSILVGNIFSALKTNTDFRTLILNNNYIEDLNRTIVSGLSNLKSLTVTYNLIRSIEKGTFADLPGLLYLDLSSNRIELFEMHNLKNLTSLKLSNNKLMAVPRFRTESGCISQRLIVLELSGNKITSLKDFVKDSKCLAALETLYLGKNKILTLDPDVFTNLKLTRLDISDFPLGNWSQTDLNKLLGSQHLLRSLCIRNSSLKYLPDHTFSSFRKLEYLNLGCNKISEWSVTTFGSNLRWLNLYKNQIRLINESTYPDAKSINFEDNPFTCDCRLQWFRNWIKTSPKASLKGRVKHYKCASPPNWKNKELRNFNPTYNDCNPWNPYVIAALAICITLILIVGFASILHSNRQRLADYMKSRRYTRIRSSYDVMMDKD